MNNEQNSKDSKPNKNRTVAYAMAFALGVGTGVGGTVLYASTKVKCCVGTDWHCHNRNLWGPQCHGNETHCGGC
jgi:hypothetical protein